MKHFINTKFKKITIVGVVLTLFSLASYAFESSSVTDDSKVSLVKQAIGSIESMATLPIEGLKLIKSNGKYILMSSNGHYAVIGNFKLIDVWNNKQIKTIDDVDKSNRVPLNVFRNNEKDFSVLTYGHGPRQVFIFTDPLCKFCNELIKQIPGLTDKYTFKILIMAADTKSTNTARRLICSSNDISTKALVTQNYNKLKSGDPLCSSKKIKQTHSLATLLGVTRVPYTIAPNGKPFKGYKQNLAKWLEENKNND